MKKYFGFIALMFSVPLCYAEWSLDNEQSNIAFVTTKATHIGEVNKFDRLTGTLNDQGSATVVIDLASVNTAIPIRDERMREHLFEVASYPQAKISAAVDAEAIKKLKVGEVTTIELNTTMDLHGVSTQVVAPVTVTKLLDQSLLVSSAKPIVINAAMVDLADGVEKLREIAGLPNISLNVTVTFDLMFTQ